MGAIQSSINQAINLGTALYTQTGAYERKKETASLKKELKGITKEDEKLIEPAFGAKARALVAETPELGGKPGAGAEKWGIAALTTKRAVSNAERALELKTKLGTATFEDYALLAGRRRTLANEQAKSKAQSKASQKKEYKEKIKQASKRLMSVLKEDN